MSQFKIISVFAFLFCLSIAHLSAQGTLADEVVGTYIGEMAKNSTTVADHAIEITRVSDERVRIASVSGTGSSTFEANLTVWDMGNVRTISFSADASLMLQNASVVPSTGRFAYAIVNMVSGSRNIEIFNGGKE